MTDELGNTHQHVSGEQSGNREKAVRVAASAIADMREALSRRLSPHPPVPQSVMSLAADIFGDSAVAEKWFEESNLATDNLPPLALLNTDEGLSRVETLLHRIEYGVLT